MRKKHSKLFYYLGIGIVCIIGLIIVKVLVINLLVDESPAYNEIPMYGFSSHEQYLSERKPSIAKIDDDFINFVLNYTHGDKRNASNAACDRGFEYFNNNDPRTAIKRFNQGWLLDYENPCVFAGYGYMYGKSGDYENATTMYQKAFELSNKNESYWWIYVDYSEIMIQCYHFSKERMDCLNKAEESIHVAAQISNASKIHRTLAFIYYEKEDYEKAWIEVHKAIDGGMNKKEFNSGFGDALRKKMPDPNP